MQRSYQFRSFLAVTLGLTSTLLLSHSPVFAQPETDSHSSPMMDSQTHSANIEAELAPAVTQRFKELGVPGAIIGVWKQDYQPWITTLGVSDLATGTPIQLNDKMRIGSITKTFTGTVLLQLVDEGKVSLDDPVSKYLPDVPNGKNITIRQIGTMSSGLFNYSEDTAFSKRMSVDTNIFWKPQQLIEVAFRNKPDFLPGEKAEYSNTNSILLGLMIEKITGNSLQAEIRKRITGPLGMQQTTFATDGNMPNPHSQGYLYGTFGDPVVPKGTPPNNVTTNNPSWAWAAGAMISTLDDLYRYAKPLATGKLLSKQTQAERLTWVDVKGLKYGFQIANYGGVIGHNGGIPGFQSFMGYLPEQDATVIVLTNLQYTWSPEGEGPGPADALARVISTQLQEK
ncbi:MAG TPA: serine hydrolase domain-containing protein [Candidatus Caenarcaniphilales bacterium]